MAVDGRLLGVAKEIRMKLCCCLGLMLLAAFRPAGPHDGPDPVGHWLLEGRFFRDELLQARLGPPGHCGGEPAWHDDGLFRSARFGPGAGGYQVSTGETSGRDWFPRKQFTVVALASIEGGLAAGSLVRVAGPDGISSSGWSLGYRDGVFVFDAPPASSRPDSEPVRLKGKTLFQPGRWHHLVAVHDGVTVELYVDGQLEASAAAPGSLTGETADRLVLGGGPDNGSTDTELRLREVALYDRAARGKWVRDAADRERLAEMRTPRPSRGANRFVVQPFLQYGSQDGMSVVWQLEQPGPATLHWGETDACDQRIESPDEKTIHQLRITGLAAETQYFYRVTAEGGELASEVRTFQTACRPGTPLAFAVIGDTQERPQIAQPVAELAWAQRPHFLLLAGDLVDNGEENSDWTEQFFPSLSPLISRVPLFPVLGNHEKNARNYFDYMALPDPEYFYRFSYGDAEFFMIDSNRNVDPGSEQYRWLDQALGESRAIWKFVCHHHPPYSSDENDYGDLWKTNQSTWGDLRIRQLVPLYEKHHVDIVWTGHIHSYERTWPVRENAAVEQGGTIYIVTGGGGGTLETAAPTRPFFQNNVRHGHHYCMVTLHRGVLEMKAFTIDDRLFDSLRIEKPQ